MRTTRRFAIKHASDLEVIPESADSSALRPAYEVADRFCWTPTELEVYDYWSIKAQDERGAIQIAEERGRQEGQLRKAQEMARTLRADGFEDATIMKYTGLSAQELADLAE